MAKATKVNQLIVETPDEVGMMAKVCSAISDAGIKGETLTGKIAVVPAVSPMKINQNYSTTRPQNLV